MLIVLGACTVMSSTVTNTTLQMLTPVEMRGRVVSIWVMTALGLAPFGNLLAGWVAQSLGAPLTLMIGGSCCAAVALLIAITYRATLAVAPQQSQRHSHDCCRTSIGESPIACRTRREK